MRLEIRSTARALALLAAWVVATPGALAAWPQAARKKAAATVSSPEATVPRSAVVFGFGGKVGPNDEGFVPGFESFKLRFGPGDWEGTRIIVTSAWGDKAPDSLWNWPDGREVRATDALRDKDGYYFIYSLATANESDWVVACFHVTLRDGRRAVAGAIIPYGGGAEGPKGTVAALGFDGRLGPDDPGYVPEFESYRLRFGPGDWAGTKVTLDMTWGEGTEGSDHWGWRDKAESRVSEVRRDAQGYYFIHSLRSAGHSRWTTSLFRFTRNGRNGVAQSLHSYSGALAAPRPVGQPANFPTAPTPPPSRSAGTAPRPRGTVGPTEADMDYLRRFANDLWGKDLAEVTDLNLTGKAIDDAGMVHLRGLRRLRSLSLWGTRVGDAGLENLAGLSDLRSLNLIGTTTTDAGLQVVGRLTGLTELYLDHTLVTDAGLRALRGLTNLEVLTLGTTDVGDAGLATLRSLPRLRRLDLGKDLAYESERITRTGLALLKSFPGLRTLNLSGLSIGDDDLAAIAGATNLELLNLTSTKVTDAGLAHLRPLTGLRELYLDATPAAAAGVAGLKGMDGLKVLSIGYTERGDDALAVVGGLKNLEGLGLTKAHVTDAGLVPLRGLTKLRQLELPDNEITGPGLVNLRGLAALEELNLYYNKLDDASLAVFRSMPELRRLSISGERVTDAGLVHLRGLAKLRDLSITWTKVTEAGLDGLRKDLPELNIAHGDY